MNINLTPVLEALIALMAALITSRLIPWIRARTTESQQKAIRTAVRVLVYAAEQIYGSGRGREKLDYVKARLAAAGYDVDPDLIEATVYKAFNG